jgi:hypothetical protein
MPYLPPPSWSSFLLARSECRWASDLHSCDASSAARDGRTPRSDAEDQVLSPRTKRALRAEGDPCAGPSAPPPAVDPEVSRGCSIKHPEDSDSHVANRLTARFRRRRCFDRPERLPRPIIDPHSKFGLVESGKRTPSADGGLRDDLRLHLPRLPKGRTTLALSHAPSQTPTAAPIEVLTRYDQRSGHERPKAPKVLLEYFCGLFYFHVQRHVLESLL